MALLLSLHTSDTAPSWSLDSLWSL